MIKVTLKRVFHELKNPAYLGDMFVFAFKTKSFKGIIRKVFKDQLSDAFMHLEESEKYLVEKDNYYKFLFTLVRVFKPEKIVETGVKYGYSSQAILQAMELNGTGHLYSIDLPSPNCEQIAGAVPESLRKRWKFISGDAAEHLPPLLEETGEIDFFLHDSLHTFDHMSFEFSTSWPSIKKNGFLISHDIHWNRAFRLFTAQKEFSVLNFNIGIIRKQCD